MTGLETGIVVAACLSVGWAIGIVMGTFTERKAWTMRAMSNKPHAPNTAHFCDGEFYYIVPEKMFCEEFTRKAFVDSEG